MKKVLNIHSAFKVIVLFPFLFFFALSQSYALDITLQWDANTEPDLAGYYIYYGTSSGNYSPAAADYADQGSSPRKIAIGDLSDPNNPEYTLTGLTEGKAYFLVVTAYDTEVLESVYSNEINTKAPQITSPPTVTSVTDSTATIEWNTDEPGTSAINYKKAEDPSYIEKELTDYVFNHSVVLTGLESNSSYVFYVSSTDSGGAGPDISDTDNNPSGIYTFQTGAGSDITAPQITSPPTVTSTTNSTAVIEWQTDEPSTSAVHYGTSSGTWGNYQWENTDTSLVTTHSVTLTGLTADTQYYFRIGSTDGFNNGPTTSNEGTFTTESSGDITAPQITSPPTVTGITQTTAVIEWQTDEPSDSVVDYGETATYDSQATLPDDVTNHSVTLTGLTAGTAYHFQVSSTDAAGNGPTYSIDTTFTTETVTTDDQAPEITSAPTVTNITDTTAVITWETDEPSNSLVRYDTASRADWSDYIASENDAGMVTSHSVTVTGLTANQTYFFMVGSEDAFGNGPDTSDTDNNPSAQQYFTTELTPDTNAPVIASVTVAGTTDTTAIIIWTTDEPSNSMVHYGSSSSTWGNYPSSENDAGMVTSHTVTITGLTQGSTYYFRVGSTDASGNGPDLNSNATNPSTQQSVITDTTPDTDAPVISNVAVAGTTDTIAIITWDTDEPSNSMVHYGATLENWGSYDSVENDAEMVTSHSVTLTGLTVGTYHFRVGSTDALSNGPTVNPDPTNPSDDATFITTEPDTAAPVISNVAVAGTTDNTATITWTTDELSNTMVRYDTASRSSWEGYQWSKNNSQMVTSHTITLTGLIKGSTYHFRVGSIDVFGNGPDLNPGATNPYPHPPDSDTSFTTTNTDTNPPSIIAYAIDYFNDTITITYSEANIQNATIEANYLFSDDTLSFRNPGGSDDITYIGDNTYQLFLAYIPDDISFTVQALSGITDEAGNSVTDDKITINVAPAPDRVKEVIPHHNAGIDDTTWIPNNTSFAVRIEVKSTNAIDTTANDSIIFTIDDGVNFPYEYNLGYGQVRVVQLDPTEIEDSVTKLWVVYDRSTDDTYGNVYPFGTTVEININVKNGLEQGRYSFKVETQQQHDDAEANPLPFTPWVDSPSPGQTTLSVNPGDLLEGAQIVFYTGESVPPTFGPKDVPSIDEIPSLNLQGVTPIGSLPMNMQPPTVFDDPVNKPVTISIPCPGHPYASALNIYRYRGTSWVLACDVGGNVKTGGEGWIVPGSRVNHDNGSPSTIEIQVYHFTGAQAGFPSGSGGRSTDDVIGGGCFIATAAYGSKMDKHVKILTEFRDRRLVTNSIGRGILDAYYTFSPPVADYLHKHPLARAVVRYALIPITGIAYISLYIHPLALLFAFTLLLLTGVYFFKRSAIRRQRSAM